MKPFAQGNGSIPDSLRYADQLKAASSQRVNIIRGLGYTSSWINSSVAAGAKIYAQFTIPIGYYMELGAREIITNKEELYYRVYLTYDAVTETADVLTRNLRADAAQLSPAPLRTCSAPATGPILSDAIITVPVFGAGAGGKASGDVSSNEVFRLLPEGATFLLEIENASSSAAYTQLDIVYQFVPKDEYPAPG